MLTVEDIEVEQRWRHKLVPKLVARLGNDDGKSVQLELGRCGEGRWVTYEVLLKYWEPVDGQA